MANGRALRHTQEGWLSGPQGAPGLLCCKCWTASTLVDMAGTVGFRPTRDDELILQKAARPGESRSDGLRRALRLLDHDAWTSQFHRDAEALKDEDVNAEA